MGAAVLGGPILPLAVGGSPVLRGAIGRLVVLRRLLVFGFGLGRFRRPRGLWRVEGVVLKGLGLIGVQRQVGNMASIRRGALRGFFRLGGGSLLLRGGLGLLLGCGGLLGDGFRGGGRCGGLWLFL